VTAFLLSGVVLLAIAQDPAPPVTSAATVLTQVEAALAKPDYGEAKRLLDELMTRTLTPAERLRALLLVGAVYTDTGRPDEALGAADEAERLSAETNDGGSLARVELLRGNVWRERGRVLQAIEHFRRALAYAEGAQDARLVTRSYLRIANAYQVLGDWSRVLDFTERAIEADPAAGDAERLSYLLQRGIAYFEFSDRDRAERDFLEALALARRVNRPSSETFALGELGTAYWEFDRDRRRALEHFEPAIALARKAGLGLLEVTWLNNSARVYRDTGDLDEALGRLQNAVDLQRRLGRARDLPMLFKNIGETLARQGRTSEALGYFLNARDEADRQSQSRFQWESRLELGRLHLQNDPQQAERDLVASIDLLEATHANALLESFRAGAMSRQLDSYDPYDLYVGLLLDRGDGARAFHVAERGRARAFLDTLSLAREEMAADVPAAYIQAENALLGEISTAQTALRGGALRGPDLERSHRELEALEEKLTTLRLRLAVDRPAVAQARYPRLWAVEDLQREVLARNEALVLFHVGRDRSAAWIVRRDAVHVLRLPSRDTIETAARAWLATMATPASSPDPVGARALTAMLLPGLETLVPDGARLIVIPHGILHHVPFEALTDEGNRHLIEKYIVSYAPSASSLAYLRRPAGPRPPGRDVVAVGNPAAVPATPAPERNFRLDWTNDLGPLPHTAVELEHIGSIFGRRARILQQDEANEAALAQALDGAGALHFATHALVDEERPDRSGLVLSPGPGSDGILQMREIYRLRVPASLVTLSACRTALGRRLAGEGVMGLSRAFFYAGADTVVASLWNVNDAAAAQWMTTFYEAVERGTPIDEAAREAKLRFLQSDTALKHPFYWAPFVATGHAAVPLQMAGPSLTIEIAALAVVGLALVAAVTVWTRAKRRTLAAGSGS
jgi:tetratricopeptide (TPR) repeat protein